MVEMRWVWHDMKDGAPPIGSVCVGDRLYQRLQYRVIQASVDASGALCPHDFGEWKDVPHSKLLASPTA